MAWDDIAPRAIASLSRDLKLSPEQAAGIVGQLGFESEGLQAINERTPVIPGSRGGFGWAQWTGPRRKAFESWADENGADINTPEANYGFLLHELSNTPEKAVLDKIRNAKDATEAGEIFTNGFLRPGIVNQDKRNSWTEKALGFLMPTAQAGTLPRQQPISERIQAALQAGFSADEIKEKLLSNDEWAGKINQAREAGFSDDEIFGKFGLKAQPQKSANPDDGSAWAGFRQGLRDPIDAGAQMLRRAVPDSVGNAVDSFGNYLSDIGLPVAKSDGVAGVDKLVNESNQQYEQARSAAGRDGMDWARLGGNVAVTLPMAAAAPQTLGGTGTFGRVLAGAAQGAGFGALQPVVGARDQNNFGSEKLKQAALGAGLGAALPAATGVLSPMAARAASPAKKLISEGIELTPGQALGGALMRLEDRAMSVPLVGDAIRSARQRGNESLNRAVYNRVLKPIGEKTDKIGREAVSEARAKINQAYDDVLSKVQFTPDSAFAQNIANLQNIAKGLPARERRAFENILQREVIEPLSKGKSVDGLTFKDIEANLGQQAVKFSRSTDAYQKDVGVAINEVQKALRENLQRMNPQYAQELKNVNESFANFVRLENAAGKIGAHDGVFTPQQLSNAIRSTDRSARKGAYSRGEALMQDLSDAAQSRMSAQIPDSGTAGRIMNAGALGAYFVNPMIPLGLAGAATPYLPGINKAVTGAITNRPYTAQMIGDVLRKLPSGVGGAFTGQLTN